MKQLRLFEFTGIDLSSKLAEEKKAQIYIHYHWNGTPW